MKQAKHIAFTLGDQMSQDITNAVANVLNKTFSIDVKPGHYVVGKGSVQLNGDVSGIVGIMQDKLEGTLTVCFTFDTVRKLVPRLLGPDIEVTQDVAIDAVGEVTNMIFGQLKTELNERGHHVRFSLPSVVKGPGHFISHMHEGHYMVMLFEMDGTSFQIHLAIHKQDEP